MHAFSMDYVYHLSSGTALFHFMASKRFRIVPWPSRRPSFLTGADVDPVAVCVGEGDDLKPRVGLGDLLEPLVAGPAGPQRVEVSIGAHQHSPPPCSLGPRPPRAPVRSPALAVVVPCVQLDPAHGGGSRGRRREGGVGVSPLQPPETALQGRTGVVAGGRGRGLVALRGGGVGTGGRGEVDGEDGDHLEVPAAEAGVGSQGRAHDVALGAAASDETGRTDGGGLAQRTEFDLGRDTHSDPVGMDTSMLVPR
mmetsp:Transcript_41607/g.97405  ORF Transcript_41607/g.97405 Transcript_41607/m.97405 type:complete len:252 (+) Transcript_41607:737-1492(+)